MSNEVEKLKELTQQLANMSVEACSTAYLLELQKKCQARGKELAVIAANIKADRKRIEKEALDANGGRFRSLRVKNKTLRDKQQTLPPDEQAELDFFEANLSKELKVIKKAEKKLDNEATPFDKIYKLVYDLAMQKQKNPNMDISKAFDEYKDTTEYKPEDEGKRITDDDKLLTLFYLKDFAQSVGIHFAKYGQEIKNPEGKNFNQAEYDEYRKTMDAMVKTTNLYMIGSSKTENGETVVGSGIFNDMNNNIIAMTTILFGSGSAKGSKGRGVVGDTYKRMIDFCSKKATQMVMNNLDKEKPIPGSPYFNEQNPEYAKHVEQLKTIKASVRFLSDEDKKSLTDQALDKAKLSFGRSGSTQFSEMETAYKDFQKRLTDYIKDSGDAQKKYLLQASIDRLDKKADAYLTFKEKQMQSKEIDTKEVRDADGNVQMVPSNSKTLQRMKFAAKIREDMSQQREFYARKEAKATMERGLV